MQDSHGQVHRGIVPPLPLARGDLSEQDAAELRALKQLVHRRIGLDFDGYKEPCLRRRIAVRMRARSLHSYAAYADLLERDPDECQRLLDAVTINVSKFFRNNEVWDAIREHVLPSLFALDVPRVRLWSAGCAGGEEAYTAAMLLIEYARANGLTGELKRFEILGTDLDRDSLATAVRGEYTEFAFTEIPAWARERFFVGNRVRDEVRELVRFDRLNLLDDPYPKHRHLILCRNVIIYFARAVQVQLFERFHEALSPGGFLVLGKVETLFGAGLPLFHSVASRERIFVRQ